MPLLPVLALLATQTAFVPGDTWTIDRTYRTMNDSGSVDSTDVERTQYRVDSISSGFTIVIATRRLIETRKADQVLPAPPATKSVNLRFGPGGAPAYDEETEDPIRARVDRMQWTAAEERKGVSWSRRFKANSVVPAGKVTVRPTGFEGPNQTVSVSYVEDGGLRGEGTATVTSPKRIVTSFKLTFKGQGTNVAVNQSLVPDAK